MGALPSLVNYSFLFETFTYATKHKQFSPLLYAESSSSSIRNILVAFFSFMGARVCPLMPVTLWHVAITVVFMWDVTYHHWKWKETKQLFLFMPKCTLFFFVILWKCCASSGNKKVSMWQSQRREIMKLSKL